MTKEQPGQWPSWPAGSAGTVMVDVLVESLSVDELFLLVHGGETEFRKKCNEALSNKDYATTPWLPSDEEAERWSGAAAPLQAADLPSLRPPLFRRATYSSTAMGVKFKSEEVMRLLEATPGSHYVLEFCVATTATYGDKFRPILRQEMRAAAPGPGGAPRASWRVSSTLVFVKSVNGLLKGMVEKGARDGMAKNMATVRRVMEGYAKVVDAAAAKLPAAPAAPRRPAAAPAAEGAAAPSPPAPPLLDAVAGMPLVGRLRPWAAYLHQLTEPYPVVGGAGEEGVLLALCALCLLGALRVVVDLVRFVQHASMDPQDTVALFTHYVFKVLDFPDSVQEVLSACLLLFLVRVLVNRLATMLPAPPGVRSAGLVPAAEEAAAAAKAAGLAPPVANGGAVAAGGGLGPLAAAALATGAATAAAASAGEPQTRSPKSDQEDQQGVQYEGYAQAIAGVDKQVRDDENALTSPPVEPSGWSSGGMQRLNEQMSAQTHKAIKSLKGNFKEFKRSMKALAGTPPPAPKGAVARERPGSPDKGPAGAAEGVLHSQSLPALAEESGDETEGGRSEPGTSHSEPASRALSPLKDRPASPQPGAARPAAVTAAAAAAAAAAAGEAAGAAAEAGGAPTGEAPPAAGPAAESAAEGAEAVGEGQVVGAPTGLPTVSPGPSRRSSSVASEAMSPTGSGGSFFKMKLGRRSGAGDRAPGSARKGEGVASPDTLSPRTSSTNEWEQGLAAGRLQRVLPTLLPPGLPAELAEQAITAEVFENQRLQPFRGWGSTWPGHFLPTDKVLRWSQREVPALPMRTSQDQDQVTPQPPEGWRWVEGDWRLDMTGRDLDAIDDDGWAYGLDFGWVERAPQHPFQPNQGKKKVTDFVRRRRWIRTLVPTSPDFFLPTSRSVSAAAEALASAAAEGGGTAGSPPGHARRALAGALDSAAPAGQAGAATASPSEELGGGEPKPGPAVGPLAAAAANLPVPLLPPAAAAGSPPSHSKVRPGPAPAPSSASPPAAAPLAAAAAAGGADAGHLPPTHPAVEKAPAATAAEISDSGSPRDQAAGAVGGTEPPGTAGRVGAAVGALGAAPGEQAEEAAVGHSGPAEEAATLEDVPGMGAPGTLPPASSSAEDAGGAAAGGERAAAPGPTAAPGTAGGGAAAAPEATPGGEVGEPQGEASAGSTKGSQEEQPAATVVAGVEAEEGGWEGSDLDVDQQ